MSDSLTQQDVQRLLQDPSPETRAAMAQKLGRSFGNQHLSATERVLAEDIVRIMAKDVTAKVRSALAESLKTSQTLPRDVAMTLARDVEAVSLPFIEVSSVLTEDDLMEIIRSGSADKQTAVAGRPDVTEGLADELVERGAEKAVAALMANNAAEVSDRALGRVLDRFPGSESVQGPMVNRAKLPVTVAERLVTMVSEQLRERLVAKHELPSDVAADLVLQSRERATYGLVGGAGEADLERLVDQLRRGNRLTPSLLLRALCMGDLPFFEVALAQMARISVNNARMLIHDAGKLGLKSLFEKAGLPPKVYPAIRIAVDVAQETEYDGGDHDLERHRRRTLERILTQFEEMASDDLDYLLTKLTDITATV
ncbi:MAG: hypothetical protein RLY86_2493 [Pseudomonadota bacterium]|jgi:uncharacterized protein (DUF2336 family)